VTAAVRAALALLLFAGAAATASEEHDHEHGAAAHDDEPRFRVEDLAAFGVTVAAAKSGDVDAVLELPAEVRPNGDRLSHLAAPFPGIVRNVNKAVGDAVRRGDVLAEIESETLTTYPLKAGFDGVVIDKHVAPGEIVTRDHRLFVVADLSSLWVEIDVYLDVLPAIRVGQAVRLEAAHAAMTADGTISYISPVIRQATRTATARVVLGNADGRWRPGLFLTAYVARPAAAAVIVPRRALHKVDGRDVVFAVAVDRFVARPVAVGAIGRSTAAIESGLAVGERFADEGSFLVKAELLKGEAAHEH
jgi:cobalt-zinc-cadmium efflux system membrane fusion protein